MAPKGLLERLHSGEKVVVAEGYLFNFERRGFLQAGPFVPTVVLDHPELVRQLHEEFVRAGSDVVQALTEQIDIIVEEGADFIIAETFVIFAEAMIAVEAIKEYGKGITSVVTLAPHLHNTEQGQLLTVDNVEITEAIKKLESAGADVVGLNCASGPDTMLSYMELIKKAGVKAPLACVPVPYRTTPKEHTFMLLTDPVTGEFVFPTNLDCALCTRDDIYKFGRRCDELGIPYIGLCCGNAAAYTRTLCESIGRKPPASKYSPCMEVHCLFGKDERVLKNHSKQSLENIVTRKGKM
ncbi:betaine--homocysteine S-methyltransferase 1-like isoform X2 [Apostichopus japonicus]|uniref:betaine--homocysteine S-methyltransferase 1-like isoform X2 n=1 Tax=Stichopus japonicus TaxID=307972 RepID=UPI003AB8D9E4